MAAIWANAVAMAAAQDQCERWLDSMRSVGTATLLGYRDGLKPLRRALGGRRIQDVKRIRY